MEPCVYRGIPTNRQINDLDVYACKVFGECVLTPTDAAIVNCHGCHTKLAFTDHDFKPRWLDPLQVFDRDKQQTHTLRNMLNGHSAFIVCGGPSATEDKLQALSKRGHFSLAVNNKAGHTKYRPQAFVFSDTSSKFSHSIWYDPAIMKFCPLPKMGGSRANLVRKDPVTKEFLEAGRVLDCPNVWGFERRAWMMPDSSFFTEMSASWGNHQAGVERTGQLKTVCTMLLGLRLLYYLGARTIYLVGVDFNMVPGQEYSFNQGKESAGASASNNEQYRVVNTWLCEMSRNGIFDRFGLSVYNCNHKSGLHAFAYCPFEEAIAQSRGFVEEEPDLRHWYERIDEQRMKQIEAWVVEGKTIDEIKDALNAGIEKERHKVNNELVGTYLKVLYERRML